MNTDPKHWQERFNVKNIYASSVPQIPLGLTLDNSEQNKTDKNTTSFRKWANTGQLRTE